MLWAEVISVFAITFRLVAIFGSYSHLHQVSARVARANGSQANKSPSLSESRVQSETRLGSPFLSGCRSGQESCSDFWRSHRPTRMGQDGWRTLVVDLVVTNFG